jgi:hypothetical protein
VSFVSGCGLVGGVGAVGGVAVADHRLCSRDITVISNKTAGWS